MIDRYALAAFRPAADAIAALLKRRGVTADMVTFLGFGLGMAAAVLIAVGHELIALAPLILSRACDGIDGALARLDGATDRGAFLDIACDFLFYASIPLAFAIADPQANALAAATLLAAFVGTGSSFLAYAIIAEKRGLKSTDYPSKSFYYLGGLTEGAETIACFALMCMAPRHFVAFAYVYAAMCLVTATTRVVAGWKAFGGGQ